MTNFIHIVSRRSKRNHVLRLRIYNLVLWRTYHWNARAFLKLVYPKRNTFLRTVTQQGQKPQPGTFQTEVTTASLQGLKPTLWDEQCAAGQRCGSWGAVGKFCNSQCFLTLSFSHTPGGRGEKGFKRHATSFFSLWFNSQIYWGKKRPVSLWATSTARVTHSVTSQQVTGFQEMDRFNEKPFLNLSGRKQDHIACCSQSTWCCIWSRFTLLRKRGSTLVIPVINTRIRMPGLFQHSKRSSLVCRKRNYLACRNPPANSATCSLSGGAAAQ